MTDEERRAEAEAIASFPFAFHTTAGRALWMELAELCPDQTLATEIAAKYAEIDSLDLTPNLTVKQHWHMLLGKAAIKGTTRALVDNTRRLTDAPEGGDQ